MINYPTQQNIVDTFEYEWAVTGLRKRDSDDLQDVIIGTNWKVTGVDEDGLTGTFNGATPFRLADVDPNNFTPFNELTETQVLGWIKNAVSGSSPTNYWSHIREQIVKEMDSKRYKITTLSPTELPWSSSGSAQSY